MRELWLSSFRYIEPLVPMHHFSTPENIRKLYGFMFSGGVEKGLIGNEWLKRFSVLQPLSFLMMYPWHKSPFEKKILVNFKLSFVNYLFCGKIYKTDPVMLALWKTCYIFHFTISYFQIQFLEYFLQFISSKTTTPKTFWRILLIKLLWIRLRQIIHRDHWFSTLEKFSEKLTFLTPWYLHVNARIRG